MRKAKIILGVLFLLMGAAACRKDEKLNPQQPVGLGGDVTTSTAIDKWLLDSLTTPYNIEVKYRWDPWSASLYRTVTPVDESRVIPLFSAMRRVWINPYNDETGSLLFMKKYAPKQMILIGSVEYLFEDVVYLGQAEGGNNIVFFDVNQNFDKDNRISIERAIHTAHHEFGHILHQNVLYPTDFVGTSSKLGLAGYTASWFNVSDADALQQGYISSYSMSGPPDDFVEMIATMLTLGKSKFEEMKAVANTTARQALQQKENYVVNYYRQVWNIDFYRLQTRVQTALNALFPPPTVTAAFGFGKLFTTASVNPANTTLLPQSAAFTAVVNSAKAGLAALNNNAGRVLDSFAIVYNSANAAALTIYYHNAAGTNLVANWQYIIDKDATNGYTFSASPGPDGNAQVIATGVAPLISYFSGRKFSIDWYADPSVTVFPRVRFTPQAAPGNYFIARMLP